MVYEKSGAYKKAATMFIKGMLKTGLFQEENGDLVVTIEKDKEAGTATLTIQNDEAGYKGEFKGNVVTRVFNKIDPTMFEGLAAQLEKRKGFGKLRIR